MLNISLQKKHHCTETSDLASLMLSIFDKTVRDLDRDRPVTRENATIPESSGFPPDEL